MVKYTKKQQEELRKNKYTSRPELPDNYQE